ncbi:hypothetical protein ACQJBY_005432 [Aegilops geniculata]
MVDHYAGTLAFKNTSSPRWHINVNIPEMKAMVARTSGMSYQIELRNMGQGQRQATESTIAALAAVDPSKAMTQYYKLEDKNHWWYMGCQILCWRKLLKEGNIYRCHIYMHCTNSVSKVCFLCIWFCSQLRKLA